MKVLVTGVGGQLGHDVMRELFARGHNGIGSDIAPVYKEEGSPSAVCGMQYVRMDITDGAEVLKTVSELKPDAVIHCAAWTAVDAAEDEENRSSVYAVNVGGTRNIADACRRLDCKLIYISTDYVFNGSGSEPWEPDCRDYDPLSVYGRTKLEGELAVAAAVRKHFIVRTAWVFGANGKNFVKTMLGVGRARDTVRVVCDQIGTPTYTVDLARLLVDMAGTEKYGCYHATGEGGFISWYDFTCEIYRLAGLKTAVIPVTTQEYGISKAARPLNSRLSKDKLTENGFERLPAWQDALSRYFAELGEPINPTAAGKEK